MLSIMLLLLDALNVVGLATRFGSPAKKREPHLVKDATLLNLSVNGQVYAALSWAITCLVALSMSVIFPP